MLLTEFGPTGMSKVGRIGCVRVQYIPAETKEQTKTKWISHSQTGLAMFTPIHVGDVIIT